MTVDQLKAFILSSRQLGHADKKVAEYVRQVKLTNRLDARAIEDIQGSGVGPKTLEALRLLEESTKSLSPPAPPTPKPVAVPIPPPSAKEQSDVLKDVTEYALEYAKKLPNFICVQVTRRFADPAGLEFWQAMDTVTARLSYFEQKEDYKVLFVNNRSVTTSMENLGGATSTGEFGSMLKEIFDPASHTQFQWERWATLRGKRMHVFAYRVPQSFSKYRVVYERRDSAVPGYRGLIYVDRDALSIMRVTLEAEDLPPAFPVQQAMTTLDYDFVDIAGSEFVLPLKATVRMRAGKLLTKNDVEFRLYKKFGAEATITYTPDPLPESQTKEQ